MNRKDKTLEYLDLENRVDMTIPPASLKVFLEWFKKQPDKLYDQEHWNWKTDCGTRACIGGYMEEYLRSFRPDVYKALISSYGYVHPVAFPRDENEFGLGTGFGLSKEEEELLFMPWPMKAGQVKTPKKVAVRVLELYLETGRVDWERAEQESR